MKRGVLWSLVATVCGATGSLVVTPVLVHRLGATRFGLYVLILTLTSYAGFFDFGLTWAAGRFFAEDYARDRKRDLAARFHTLVRLMLAVGGMSLVIALVAGPLTRRAAVIEAGTPVLVPFILAAASFGLSLQAGLAASLLRACQRFDDASKVVALGSVLLPAGSYVAVCASSSLTPLLCVNALVNAGLLGVYLVMTRTELRGVGRVAQWEPRYLREMASFGGWSSISRLTQVLMLQVDRLAVALLGSVAGLTYYAVPANLAARVNVLGGPFANIFLSRASLLHAQGNGGELGRQHASATRFLVWAAAAAAAPLVLLGPEFLRVWIGDEMGRQGGTVLVALALGHGVIAVASLDAVTLEATGRPDLPAKAAVAWAVVAAASVVALAPALGARIVAYAAGGWLAGVGLTNSAVVRRVVLTRARREPGAFPLAGLVTGLGIAAITAWLVRPLIGSLLTALLALALVGGSFVLAGFFLILSESDRELVGANLRRFIPSLALSPRSAGSPPPPVQP